MVRASEVDGLPGEPPNEYQDVKAPVVGLMVKTSSPRSKESARAPQFPEGSTATDEGGSKLCVCVLAGVNAPVVELMVNT